MNSENALAVNEEAELMAPTSTEGLHFTNPSEFPDLDEAEAGVSLEMKYYDFAAMPAVVRAIYNGMTQINKKDQKTGEMTKMNAAVFQTKEGVFLNSGDNLMNQLAKLMPGTPIQITFEGKEKTSGGNNVNKFSVRILNLKGAAATPLRTVTPPTTAPAAKAEPSRDAILSRYTTLLTRAATAGVKDIETWYINDKTSNEEILEMGRALREITESYEQDKVNTEFPF